MNAERTRMDRWKSVIPPNAAAGWARAARRGPPAACVMVWMPRESAPCVHRLSRQLEPVRFPAASAPWRRSAKRSSAPSRTGPSCRRIRRNHRFPAVHPRPFRVHRRSFVLARGNGPTSLRPSSRFRMDGLLTRLPGFRTLPGPCPGRGERRGHDGAMPGLHCLNRRCSNLPLCPGPDPG